MEDVNFKIDMKMDNNSLIAVVFIGITLFGGYVYSIKNGIYPVIERDDNLKKTKVSLSNGNHSLTSCPAS